MLSDFNFICIPDIDTPHPISYAKTRTYFFSYDGDFGIELLQSPHTWTVCTPQQSLSGHAEVYVAVRDTIFLVDYDQVVDQV